MRRLGARSTFLYAESSLEVCHSILLMRGWAGLLTISYGCMAVTTAGQGLVFIMFCDTVSCYLYCNKERGPQCDDKYKHILTSTSNSSMALPTKGRVIIDTTAGEIDIELWSKVRLTRRLSSITFQSVFNLGDI